MQPMKLLDLRDLLFENEVIDPTVRTAVPLQVAEAFETLKKKHEDPEGSPSEKETQLYYECALLLAQVNYKGLGAQALATITTLPVSRPGISLTGLRETQVEDDTPDPDA